MSVDIEERFRKLPAWAQAYIASLANRLNQAERQIKFLSGEVEGPVRVTGIGPIVDNHLGSRELVVPDYSHWRYIIHPGAAGWLEVGLAAHPHHRKRHAIEVRCGFGTLTIEPDVSNVIRVLPQQD